jgi:hypothetical protein
MLQRAVSEDLLARVFGVLEGLTTATVAVGSVLASALVSWLGGRGALLVTGLVLPAIVAASWRSLRRIEARTKPPGELIELLRGVPMFAPLPPLSLERLATSADEVAAPAGSTIMREGEPGHDFHVIQRGRVDVLIGGKVVNELDAGDSFGEIALVHDVPRTASVVAVTDLVTFSIGRDVFLRALNLHPASASAARRIADERRSR